MQPVYMFLATSGEFDLQGPTTVLEIGAAKGEDTQRLGGLFPKGRLFAFEPDPRNIAILRGGILPPHVTLIEAAIGAADGRATFHQSDGVHPDDPSFAPPEWTYSSSLKAPQEHLQKYPWVRFDRKVEVEVMSLDSFAQKHSVDKIDFIWADVQGAEDLMIAGGQRALAKTRYLFTEYADRPLYSGQITLQDIHRRLPGGENAWRLVSKWKEDALFKNIMVS